MIPLRQPLPKLTVTGWIPLPEYFEQISGLLLDECNVKKIEYIKTYEKKVKNI